jgi:hypothetical protein
MVTDIMADTTNSTTEITIQELGESLSLTLAGVQQELARYSAAVGRYLLDEIELDVPVRLRIDELGQVMTTIANAQDPANEVTRIHLRLRPANPDEPIGLPAPGAADQPLSILNISEQAVYQLQTYRIFSIRNFIRVASTPSGYQALLQVNLGWELADLLDRAFFASSPELPSTVVKALFQFEIRSRQQFVEIRRDTIDVLARNLSEGLQQRIEPEHIIAWQDAVRASMKIPLPNLKK